MYYRVQFSECLSFVVELGVVAATDRDPSVCHDGMMGLCPTLLLVSHMGFVQNWVSTEKQNQYDIDWDHMKVIVGIGMWLWRHKNPRIGCLQAGEPEIGGVIPSKLEPEELEQGVEVRSRGLGTRNSQFQGQKVSDPGQKGDPCFWYLFCPIKILSRCACPHGWFVCPYCLNCWLLDTSLTHPAVMFISPLGIP